MSGGLASTINGAVVGTTSGANAEGMHSTGHLLDVELLEAAWRHNAALALEDLPIEVYRREAMSAAKLHAN